MLAERIVSEARRSPAAVLFGAERTGLTNDDLEAAHVLIRIPANEAYLSLNLAMAVQLVAYELFRARGAKVVSATDRSAAGDAGGHGSACTCISRR